MKNAPTASKTPRPSPMLFPVLVVGLICISCGSILVRYGQEAPSLAIAFHRMLWATLLFSPFYWFRKRRPAISHWPIQLLAGFALALHFAFWISSLRFTSVAVSVLLVNTSPILVATASYVLFREKLTARGVFGLVSALLGTVVLFWNDLTQLGDWRGSVLAILGATALGAYLLAGRRLRQRQSLIEYVYPTYGVAAVVLGLFCLFGSVPVLGFSNSTLIYLFLLGLIPQCLGHTSYNWALRDLSATTVSVLVLAEPILATILAWWLLDEKIDSILLFGGLFVGMGIYFVSRSGVRTKGSQTDAH